MTKNTKIILGVGAVALALYVYNKNKKAKSSVTPSTGGERPEPVPMPTPVPDIPKKEEGGMVYYCNDGTRQVVSKSTGITTIQFKDPCKNNGGTDFAKTKKNEGGGKQKPIKGGSTQNSDDYKYEVLENFSVEYFSSTTDRWTTANFTKGQIIHAKPIPMGKTSGLATTPDGRYPNMGIGNAIVNVPINKLKRIN